MSIVGLIIVYCPLNRQTVPGPTTAEIASLYCSKSVSPYKTVRYKKWYRYCMISTSTLSVSVTLPLRQTLSNQVENKSILSGLIQITEIVKLTWS